MALPCLLTAAPAPAAADPVPVVVVANPNLAVREISLEELRDIYLGEEIFLGGYPVVLMDYRPSHPVRTAFVRQLLGMENVAFDRHWVRHIFRWGGHAPHKVGSVEEGLRFVAETPGAVGYFPADRVTGKEAVRVIYALPPRNPILGARQGMVPTEAP